MALLEEAKMSEMVDFIGESLREAEAADSDSEDVQQVATDEEPEVEMESSEAAEDVNEEEASPSNTEEDVKEEPGEEQDVVEVEAEDSQPEETSRQKDSKWVPRDRINEVNDKWRQREQQLLVQLGHLEERTKQLKENAQPQRAPQQAADDDWLSDFIEEGGQAPAGNTELAKLRATQEKLSKWQQDFTRQMVYNEFNSELQSAMEKYPDIPEDVFRNAVARDGSVNMLELGEAVSSERNRMVSKWKADWESTNKPAEEAVEPDAVRRPSRRTPPPAAPKGDAKSYSTVREAGDAMAKEMAEFFENLNQ